MFQLVTEPEISWWPTWTHSSSYFVNICYKVTFTLKGKQGFSILLLGHQKQICKILQNMSNVKCLFPYCITLLFFHFSHHWEAKSTAWNFCILIFSPPVRIMPLVLCFFFLVLFCSYHLHLNLGFLLFPPLDSPSLYQRIWCEYGNSPQWESECIAWHFCIFIFSPTVCLMRVVLNFFGVFYISRPRFFVLANSPIWFPPLFS